VRSASGPLLSLKSMAEVTADWLMSDAHQDGRLGDDALFVTRVSPPPVTEGVRANHQDTTMGQPMNEGEPTSQMGVDDPSRDSRRPDQSRQGYAECWFQSLISASRPIAIIKARDSSTGRAGPRLDKPARRQDPQAAQALNLRALGASASRRIARPQRTASCFQRGLGVT
jgi:hypothetical protein